MKTIHYRLLTITIVFFCLFVPNGSFAYDAYVDGIYYNLNTSEKTATVTLKDYNIYSGEVTIPATFSYNGSIYNVTSIGEEAFCGCEGLASIEIPNSVTRIEGGAFYECTSLTSVTIPNSVTSIGYFAFSGCTGLTSIEIPNSVTGIGEDAFYGCTGLTSIEIPNSVVYLDQEAFANCTGLNSIAIPCSVTDIGWAAFSGCTGLTSIKVDIETPLALERDELDAFYGVDKTNCTLYVPSGSKSAYQSASGWSEFQNIEEFLAIGSCGDNLTYTIYSDMSMVISGTGGICNDFAETYINDYRQSIQNLIIEEGITTIGDAAFSGCTGLTSVIIPNSVTLIDWFCFSDCTNLVSISFPINETNIGGFAFSNTAWLGNQPNGVVYLGNAAYCYKGEMPEGTTIIIKDGIYSISANAFSDCTGLVSVTFPTSLTSINSDAFSGCSNLTSIYALGRTPASAEEASSFLDVDFSKCILYVPMGCKSAYQQEVPWVSFVNIVEYNPDPDTDITTLDNAVYVEQTEGRIGGTKDISVKMKNDFDVRGFQFSMELPEGSTINSLTLNQDRMPAGITMNKVFSTENIDGNKINVVCVLNDGLKTFTGNDGAIATVNVSFAEDMEEGSYPIYLTDISISDASAEHQLELSDIKATLILEDYVLGDTNGDGKVLVGDVISILNYIVGFPSENFNAKAADVNGDGKVLVGDVIAVLNIIVNL